MKRSTIIISLVVVLILLLGSVSVALAAKPEKWPDGGKPQEVIERSNGFPSGQHFNLNLHGRELGWDGTPEPGGKSVYVGLSGNSTIEYVSNKKSKATNLYTIDPLAEPFDEDPARVFLPYKINIGDDIKPNIVPAGGYYVFGRILGSPGKGSSGSSRIMIWPTFVVQTCNSTGVDDDAFGEFRDCVEAGDLALGLITSSGNLYDATEQEFVRFPDQEPVKGKGNSKGVDISDLYQWSGYVTDNLTLDTNGPEGVADGYLDEYDVPAEYDQGANGGNDNGTIEQFELINWLEYLESIGEVIHYEDEWIFDIADLVIAGQTVTNDGAKLFQIRFYPIETTNFSPAS